MADNDRIEVYADKAGGYRWRRVASNNETLSSGESHRDHRDHRDAERAARRANPDLYDEETP